MKAYATITIEVAIEAMAEDDIEKALEHIAVAAFVQAEDPGDEVTAITSEATFSHTYIITEPARRPVASHRVESDPCERGTVGCSIDHTSDRFGDGSCEAW